MINLDDIKCLYKVQAERKLALGDTRKPWDDVDCFYCTEFYSAILCPHYINRVHLQEFKKFDIRTQ